MIILSTQQHLRIMPSDCSIIIGWSMDNKNNKYMVKLLGKYDGLKIFCM